MQKWYKDLNIMKKTVKYMCVVLALALLPISLFASCAGDRSDGARIICTSFAQYDFTLNILGEKADSFNVRYLLDNGIDMHSYSNSISVSDKADILGAALFICVGGASEKWVDELLEGSADSGPKVIKLINEVGDTVCLSHTDHSHTHNSHGSDEHIWLSPKRAILMCDAICDGICDVDPENAEIYKVNCENYKKKLEKLDSEYEKTVEDAKNAYLVFADRFPFVYLTSDYSIEYSAAFDGCSSESNASFETVAELVSDINKNGVKVIITLEQSKDDIADVLISQSGDRSIKTLKVSSMQNVTKKDISNGITYLSEMERNLEVFGKAMN